MGIMNGIRFTHEQRGYKVGVLFGHPLLLTWGVAKSQPTADSQAHVQAHLASAAEFTIVLPWL